MSVILSGGGKVALEICLLSGFCASPSRHTSFTVNWGLFKGAEDPNPNGANLPLINCYSCRAICSPLKSYL